VLVPAGRFAMGSPDGEADRDARERLHERVIGHPFYLGETEVTVAQFRAFTDATGYATDAERGTPDQTHTFGSFAAVPAGDRDWSTEASWRRSFPNFEGDGEGAFEPLDTHPVVHVTWWDARRFCEHFGFSLPSEAQWEYACRAGTRTAFVWGDVAADGKGWGNVADRSARARFAKWNQGFEHDDGHVFLAATRTFKPNAWGLHDMIGNVEEWCADGYRPDRPADGTDERALDGAPGSGRILRGSSWLSGPSYSRSASWTSMSETSRRDFIGFRVALPVARLP
jgi:sulfatase modifying factor 1